MTNPQHTFPDRLWNRVNKNAPPPDFDPSLGHCWIWTGPTVGKPGFEYGQVQHQKKRWYIHRFAYEVFVGPIPEGHQVDHKCHVKLCLRPDHLQAATARQNKENFRTTESNSRSGIRGVFWHPKSGKWQVLVFHKRRGHSGGLFADKEEAGRKAAEMRNQLHTNNLADR